MKSITLEVNGQSFSVYPPETAKQLEKWNEKLCSIPFTRMKYRVEGGYEWWRKILLAAGHNPDKIDPAVPEEWARRHGFNVACWTYENNRAFGEPLYYSEVYHRLDAALAEAFWKWIEELEV